MRINKMIPLVAIAFFVACADDDAEGTAGLETSSGSTTDQTTSSTVGASDTAAASSSGDASGSSTGPDIDALYDCVETDLQEARPLSGPGFDVDEGGLLEPIEDSYVVSSTMILVYPEAQEDFFEVAAQVSATLDASPGMVAYALAIEPNCGFARTISVYRSESDMMAFVASDAHAMAIARTDEFSITGKVTTWEMAAPEFPPTWALAGEKLAAVDPF